MVVAAVFVVRGASEGRAPGRAADRSTHPQVTVTPPTSIATTTTTVAPDTPPSWQVAWGSTMAWAYPHQTTANDTVRSVVQVPVDGIAVKVRISNRFGNAPLVVGAATLGKVASGAALVAGSAVPLSFAGSPTVTVAPGSEVLSDPVAMTVQPSAKLAASIYVKDTDAITSHYPCCEPLTPSYVSFPGSGNLSDQATATGFGYAVPWSRLVNAVDVERPAVPAGEKVTKGSIVVVGDSISDGFNSAARWPQLLQQRVAALPLAERSAVIDEGNTANALTAVQPSDATTGGGPPGLQRLTTDALDLPGVSTVLLFLGSNDVFFGASSSAVIAGLQQAASAAHAAGVRIVAVDILPRDGDEGWTQSRQEALQQVNTWLLGSHVFDGVINLASVVADMYNGGCRPQIILPAYDSGDHVHPNAAGDTAMANAIPPALLGLPSLPTLPPALAVTPTPGCGGAPGIPSPEH